MRSLTAAIIAALCVNVSIVLGAEYWVSLEGEGIYCVARSAKGFG